MEESSCIPLTSVFKFEHTMNNVFRDKSKDHKSKHYWFRHLLGQGLNNHNLSLSPYPGGGGGGTRSEKWWVCAAGRWKLDPKRSREKWNLGPKRSNSVRIGSFNTTKDRFGVGGWEKIPQKDRARSCQSEKRGSKPRHICITHHIGSTPPGRHTAWALRPRWWPGVADDNQL